MLRRSRNKYKYLYYLKNFVFIILTAILALSISCKSYEIEKRIKRVENGLLKAVSIKGQPAERMKLAERMEYYKVPGVSIAVINNYGIEWAKGYGVLEEGGSKTVTPDTLFQAASISKPVAALAALHFVEEGLINLDEDINSKLLSWKVPENEFTSEKKVTLRRLLSHRAGVTVSGFGGYAQGEEIPTLQQILDGKNPANSAPILVDMLPGSELRYSGGGYCIIQQLLIDLKGKPFHVIMQETVLSPLGMTNSTYSQPLPLEKTDSAASGHRNNGIPIEGRWNTYPEMAAAGLWTTPTDLCRFALELMLSLSGKSNIVVSENMMKQMLTSQHTSNGHGLGIFVVGEDYSFHFNYGGSNEGFQCFSFAYPEKGKGAAIMTNSDNGGLLYSEILGGLADEYGLEDYLPKEKAVAEIKPEIYDLYIGNYQLSPDFAFIITKENGMLYAEAPYSRKAEIYPQSETEFFFTEIDAQITFVKDEQDKVIALVFKRGRREWTAKKVK